MKTFLQKEKGTKGRSSKSYFKRPAFKEKVRQWLFLLSLVIVNSAHAQNSTVTLTSAGNGTWTVPSCVYSITVEVTGGGGSGARSTSNGCARGGGGGGAFAQKTISVTPGQIISYSIGGGGTGGGNGGNSWFFNTSTLLAEGGRGAADNSQNGVAGGSVSGSVGDIVYAGGNGGNGSGCGSSTSAGGGGGAAGSSGTGKNGNNGPGSNNGGTGGGTTANNGGNGGNGAGSAGGGGSGGNYGGGGGGAKKAQVCIGCSNQNGGNGAQGIIIITVHATPTLSGGNIDGITNGSSICFGIDPGAFSNSAAASGGTTALFPPTYQWQRATNSSFTTGLTNIGTNSSTYDPDGSLPAGTYYFRRSVTDACDNIAYSNIISYTVRSAYDGGTISSTSQTICHNTSPANITYSTIPSGGTTPTYQWYQQTGVVAAPSGVFNSTGWVAVGSPSTSSPTLSGTSTGNLTQTTTFALRVYDSGTTNCYNNWSGSAHTVHVRPAFSGGNLNSTSQTICHHTIPADISYSASPGGGSSPTYQWYKQTGNIATPSGVFNATGWTITGAPSSSTSILTGAAIGNLTETTTFALHIYDSGSPGCINHWAGNSHTVHVGADFKGGILNDVSQLLCYNNIPSDITFSVSPDGGVIPTYQWYQQTGSVSAPSGAFNSAGWTAIGLPGTSAPTLPGAIIGPLTQTTTFALRVYDGHTINCIDNWSGDAHTVLIKSSPDYGNGDVLATGNSNSSCLIDNSDWHYFRNDAGQIIAAINSYGSDLGDVDVSVTVEASSPQQGNGGAGEGGLCLGVSELSVKRWYTITPQYQPVNTSVGVRLYITEDEYTAFKNDIHGLIAANPAYEACYGTTEDASDLSVSKDESIDIPVSFISSGTGPGNSIEYEFYVSSFSTFRFHTTGGIGSPLPVELISFTGVHKDGRNVLEWETASENNTNRFEIESSNDGKAWVRKGAVKATGFSSIRQFYQYTDNEPHLGDNYYRLKIIDEDNTLEYSKTIHVHVQGKIYDDIISVYPNPAAENLTVIIASYQVNNTELKVSNILGQPVKSIPVSLTEGNNNTQLYIGDLPPGTYLLSVMNHLGHQFTKTFIKQ